VFSRSNPGKATDEFGDSHKIQLTVKKISLQTFGLQAKPIKSMRMVRSQIIISYHQNPAGI
jgi:hypothetical protein